jgi:hypothetical protein
MKTLLRAVLALSIASVVYAAGDVVSAVHGTIDKVDSASKTVVVKSADGTEHTFHFADTTAVHGADATAGAAKDSWHGMTKGTEVVAHYTGRGADKTAVELDRVGKGGLDVTKGTVKSIDRGGKTLVVDTGHGTEKVFDLTAHAATDAGKGVAKGSKVAVYSAKDSGKDVAHFFERM